MQMRTFLANDGTTWTVWLVVPSHGVRIAGMPDQWLSFQNEEATERCRLLEVPANWASLPDQRLDLLRRMATPHRAPGWRHSPPGGQPVADDAALAGEVVSMPDRGARED